MFRCIIFIGLLNAFVLVAQQPLSTAPQDTIKTAKGSETGDLVLDAIDIQGSIEKPGVIVVPKRVEPEMGEVELDRNFDNEVKNGVEAIPQPKEALGQVDGVKSIKKAVERKRN